MNIDKYNCFTKDNVEIYYEDNRFSIIDHKQDNSIGIIHKRDAYFRVITSDELIIDCVLDIRIEYSSNKNKIIFEVGVEDTTSGFCSKLLNVDDKYVLYLTLYSPEEMNSFEFFQNP